MTRSTFGGTTDDSVEAIKTVAGQRVSSPQANVSVTFWSAKTGGAQYTDLLDGNGNPASAIASDENGQLPEFQGPDGVLTMWADAGDGRVRINTSDGTAAAAGYASAAAASAAAAAAVGTTNDTIIAGRVNDGASATRAAMRVGQVVNALDPKYGQTVNGILDNTTGLDAAWADAIAGNRPLYIPAGSWVYNGTGFAHTSPRLYGDPNGGTSIALGSGVSLLVSPGGGPPTSIGSLSVRDIRTTGGYGLVRLTYTGANSSTTAFVVDRCRIESFSGTAISSLASDHPYWKIRALIYNPASTGTGVALAGLTDACDIDVDLQGLRVGVKLAKAGNNAHIRGSWVGLGAYPGYPRVPIWIVPATSTTNAGAGFTVNEFRFGNENYDARDFRVLYADEDGASGSDFASKTPLMTASTGFIIGHVVKNCMVNGAGSAPAGPVIYSTTPNVRGNDYEVTLAGTMPDYVLKFLTAPGPDSLNVTNKVKVNLPDRTTRADSVRPSNGYGVVKVQDLDGQFSRFQEVPIAYFGAANAAGSVQHVTSTPTTLAGSATKTAIPDALGGADAFEVTYTNAGADALFATVTAANVVAGLPLWISCDIKAGSSASLTDIEVRWRYATGTKHESVFLPVTSRWVPHLLMTVPREAASNFQAVFYAHNEASGGKADIGRVRIYQAREPLPVMPTGRPVVRTSAQFLAATDVANVSGKLPGQAGFDTTLNKPVWATGSAATATWVDSTGTTVHTPV